MRFELSWTNCLILILLAIISVRTHLSIKTLKGRIAVLELASKATVEIHVERAFDADMGVYDYQLVDKSGKATPIKRGRKRMSQLSEHY